MKLHFLKYFSVLGEELHFGRAAARLSITQPPLSAAIKSLEDELGSQLLLRNSKHVQLTPAGVAFLVEARQILERVSRAASLVKSIDSGMTGRLDVGMSPALIYRHVPLIVEQFSEAVPGVELVLHEMPTHEQLERLLHGQIDAAFVNGSAAAPQLRTVGLPDDVFVLCLPERHKKAGSDLVSLSEMANDKFIMFSREIGPGNHDNIVANFSRAGIHPRTVHQARTWLTMMAMVAEGCGVALVPRSMERAKIGGVRLVPLADHAVVAPAMLVWNPALIAPALAKFLESAGRTIAAL